MSNPSGPGEYAGPWRRPPTPPAYVVGEGVRGRWIGGRWVESPDIPAVADTPPLPSGYEESPPQRGRGWRRDLPFRWEFGAYTSLVLVALAMRLWDLAGRAVHHDESLHGFFSWQLYTGGGFVHNPLMHGPFQFELTAATFFLFGDSEFTLRLPPAIFGTALVLMPLLLRRRLGNVSALIIAAMLAFSPTLLYFSRFARNDIYMAVWTVALIAMVWRYMDEQKPRYLYIAAALIALGFATKENQFMIVAILSLPLFVMARRDVIGWIWGRRKISEWGPAGGMLVLIATLTLPMVGAITGLIQDALGVTLASNDNSLGIPLGSADGSGETIAVVLTVLLLAISVAVGVLWNWRLWLRSFAIAASIYVVLFTTVFTNWGGVASGVWQSLGYWVAQQDVARGNQPDYYYVMLTSVYEFLPAGIGLIAAVYYAFKGDAFTRFLAYWPLATFAAYSIAGEKMPWLEVHVALAFILLAGKALGDVVTSFAWRPSLSRGGIWAFLGVPVAVVILWRLIFLGDGSPGFGALGQGAAAVVLFGILALLGVGLWWLVRRIGRRPAWGLVGVSAVALMAVLTFRAAWISSYRDPGVPTELLVYTQTSPALADLAGEIEDAAELTGAGHHIKVTIDASSGFTWPWTWYLRDYTSVAYPNLGFSRPDGPSDSTVAVVHARNKTIATPAFTTDFSQGRRLPHRQWFPETYKNTTFSQFLNTIIRPTRWRNALNFFLYRDLSTPIGSEDAFVYFNKDVPLVPLE